MSSLDRLKQLAGIFAGPPGHSDFPASQASSDAFASDSDKGAGLPPIQPGDRLGDRFRILGFLGRGGMGCVYAAEDLLLGTTVAVKAIRSERVADDAQRQALIREVQLGRLVTHPNVCRLYDIAELPVHGHKLLFVTMELLRGETLAERLSRKPGLTEAEAESLTLQLVEAMAALHRAGLIHRDFKPANVMLVDGRAVVMDFGLAHLFDESGDLSQTSVLAGTPAYMAPEQAAGRGVSSASDVYAMGLVITEMFTGLPVRFLLEKSDQETHLSVAARAVLRRSGNQWRAPIRRCLEADPADRYASAVELQQALSRRRGRPRGWILGALTAAVLAVIGLGVWVQQSIARRLPAERHVAVLGFRPVPGSAIEADQLSGLSEAVSQDLSHCCGHGAAWFVPSSESRLLGSDAAAKAGRALGVNLILSGTAREQGGNVVFDLAVADAGTLRVLRTGSVPVSRAGLAAGESALVTASADLLELPLRTAALSPLAPAIAPGALQYRQKALDYLRRSDLGSSQTALALLRKAIEEDDRYGAAHADLARVMLALYRLTKDPVLITGAVDESTKAQKLDGETSGVLMAQAQISHFRGDSAEAIRYLERAVSLDADDVEAAWLLADYYDEGGDALRAEQTYLKAMNAHPGDWRLYSKLGVFCFRHGQNAEAERYYRIACDLAPDNVQATYSLGGLLLNMGKPREAYSILEHGVAIKPSAGGYSNLGSALFLDKQFAKAVEAFERAVELAPADHRYRRNLGDAQLLAGMAAKARQSYEKALELVARQIEAEPGNAALQGARALYLAKCGRDAEARQQVAVALRGHGNDRDLLFRCAIALELAADRAGALKLLKGALAQSLSLGEVQTAYELERLRADPRFAAMTSNAKAN